MSVCNLEFLFRPGSVAVFGASSESRQVGSLIMRNLLAGSFNGPVMPVNPDLDSVAGVLAYRDAASLPVTPDLAVICTPARSVPALVEELGARGTRAVAIVTAGLDRELNGDGERLDHAVLRIARRHSMRILGPNCLGLMSSEIGLNASFAHIGALPGKIAFVSQSGALGTTVLDWARSKRIGFSHFLSLGDTLDIDFGDALDYLACDNETKAILLYIESIRNRRGFMSAARAAARTKPVVVIKAGHGVEGQRAAASHTGALAGADSVYDAAISRAGMLRVYDFSELFSAVETLARSPEPLAGDRLVVMTNGGGPGVMAVDRLVSLGGRLAELSPETLARLDALLPATWSRGNPVDIIGDAGGERYAAVLEVLLQADEGDAVLVMHAPTGVSSSLEAAEAVLETVQRRPKRGRKYVLTNWLGERDAAPSRERFSAADMPSYRTPESAAVAFMHLVRYRRNQELLMETPPSAPVEFQPRVDAARRVVGRALAAGHSMLTEAESRAVLDAFGVPTVETHVVADLAGAERVAARMGYPVALKIVSHDISHRSDIGGVVLDLGDAVALHTAGEAMLARVREAYPEASVEGFSVQCMARRHHVRELNVGATCDPIFGPVILFGEGGTAVELIGDRAVALPPLNMSLARELISRTRISRLLGGYREQPAADLDAVCLTLMQVSQMMIDIPEIVELDINPLFAGPDGVLAVDACICVETLVAGSAERLAIRPYPKELEERIVLRSGQTVLLRPIRPEDEDAHFDFLARLSIEDIYSRFFGVGSSRMSHREMARLTQIDYDREMAFIAIMNDAGGKSQTIGVVRTLTDPDNQSAEYAIITRTDLKGQGLGRMLMEKMIDYCRARGTAEIVGQVLPVNQPMLNMTRKLGFQAHHNVEDGIVNVRLALREGAG